MEIEECGTATEALWTERLDLPRGIPSHETCRQVFALINPRQCEARGVLWVQGLSRTGTEVIAMDGKTLRRAHDQKAGKHAVHLVRAWMVDHRVVLAHPAPDEPSHEMTAMPLLRTQRARHGWMGTSDAMGTHDGYDALALNDTQGHREVDVQASVAPVEKDSWADRPASSVQVVAKGHERRETRADGTISDPAIVVSLDPQQKRKNLRGMGMARSHRKIDDEVCQETRSFQRSVPGVNTLVRAVRSYRYMENRLYGVLTVACWEDASRVRRAHADEHVAGDRYLSLTRVHQEPSSRVGTHAQHLTTGWDPFSRSECLIRFVGYDGLSRVWWDWKSSCHFGTMGETHSALRRKSGGMCRPGRACRRERVEQVASRGNNGGLVTGPFSMKRQLATPETVCGWRSTGCEARSGGDATLAASRRGVSRSIGLIAATSRVRVGVTCDGTEEKGLETGHTSRCLARYPTEAHQKRREARAPRKGDWFSLEIATSGLSGSGNVPVPRKGDWFSLEIATLMAPL